ncbi:hypothetical protein [Sulfitobacter sp. HGT1]|jgi:hypothetical protein|uniref:hypothetical protein n=1 Tax=unclassified Sulfitobacter TaxID=196795 RepID=UPI001592DC89|nr:hypothetical protein [Sulfitobacter sp. HGT1]
MKHIALIFSLICLPGLPLAQDLPDEGQSMMERGVELFLEGLKKEMAPALEDLSELGKKLGPALQEFASEMGPAFADLLETVEDWSVYEAPEILPNGDIIIKRKPDVPVPPPAKIIVDQNPEFDI